MGKCIWIRSLRTGAKYIEIRSLRTGAKYIEIRSLRTGAKYIEIRSLRTVARDSALLYLGSMKTRKPLMTLGNIFSNLANLRKDSVNGKTVEECYETLRKWRNDLARERKVLPFTILSNRTLRAIATACPADEAELLEVHGIGPVKLAQYGADIFEVLANS